MTVLPVQRATNVTQGLVWGVAAPGGSLITPGVVSDLYVPWDFAISKWVVQARPAGSLRLDVWAGVGITPDETSSIIAPGGMPPELVDADYGDDELLLGWSTHHPAGSTLTAVIASGVIGVSQFTFTLVVRRE